MFEEIPLDEFSVFFKKGSFIPLRVTEDTPWLGSEFIGWLRWLLYLPPFSTTPSSTTVRDQNGTGMVASYRWHK
jgi:hypothetical protein